MDVDQEHQGSARDRDHRICRRRA
ncbi:hypothetical protein Goshw_004557 [Gossypium schwendimanii]|uniref:Uncharacterized protein n=6 Tax=Gossypium TaxID=3633 RepID=A0A7J9DJ60_9ROSI|nr:hypothetical protein [Gossypium davidsonii]MBA0643187.1 hypothetical protein [Gossypium klotzschianum]MBA0677551.1 hypothetical protein [Gossypium aridum]MBA0760753.1 hypothetical protein [Gossypium trilobum]MBA0793679.1 hypothetical protein [Gossypium harknessii]MBA0848607.1 hypothetical protein [Gossypium schwendimanii]